MSDLDAGDARGNRVLGNAILIDSDNCYVQGDQRVVAAVGVRDLVIVESGDAVLVAHRDKTQEVRAVSKTARRSPPSATHHLRCTALGSYTILEDCGGLQVKR